jgi:hypothetical protein
MSDGITAEFVGLPGLMAELRQIPQLMQTRIMKGACATGAAVFKAQVTANAQAMAVTGTLARAVYMTRLVSECTSNSEKWFVGVRSGKKDRHSGPVSSKFGPTQGLNRDAFYAAWVEYGHFSRIPKSTVGANRKARHASATADGTGRMVPAHPFVRPAFDAKKVEATRAMEEYIRGNLQTAVAGLSVLRVAA